MRDYCMSIIESRPAKINAVIVFMFMTIGNYTLPHCQEQPTRKDAPLQDIETDVSLLKYSLGLYVHKSGAYSIIGVQILLEEIGTNGISFGEKYTGFSENNSAQRPLYAYVICSPGR